MQTGSFERGKKLKANYSPWNRLHLENLNQNSPKKQVRIQPFETQQQTTKTKTYPILLRMEIMRTQTTKTKSELNSHRQPFVGDNVTYVLGTSSAAYTYSTYHKLSSMAFIQNNKK